jgi:hypothetical protein
MPKVLKGRRKEIGSPAKKFQFYMISKLKHISPRMIFLTCALLAFLCLLLMCYQQASALLTTNPKKLRTRKKSDGLALSLWLIPPRTTYEKLKRQMDELSQNGKRGPAIAPHITVIGGISCQSDAHALEIARSLEKGLSGFGEIPCTVSSVDSKDVWSQALYFTVERSEQLMNLCEKVRDVLGLDTENWTFPSPALRPHLSLFYGVDNVPDKTEVQLVAPFHAYRIALWRTDPPTLEGVKHWKEISSFDIR